MDVSKKVKMATNYAGVKELELSERLGTSASAFNQKRSRGKFSVPELEKIAEALGCEVEFHFVFKDGTKI